MSRLMENWNAIVAEMDKDICNIYDVEKLVTATQRILFLEEYCNMSDIDDGFAWYILRGKFGIQWSEVEEEIREAHYQEMMRRDLSLPSGRRKILMMVLGQLVSDKDYLRQNLGSITADEVEHLYKMWKYKPIMEQLNIKKDYWSLTEEDLEEISLQEARNQGYEV